MCEGSSEKGESCKGHDNCQGCESCPEQDGVTDFKLTASGPILVIDLDHLRQTDEARYHVITKAEEIGELLYNWELFMRNVLKYDKLEGLYRKDEVPGAFPDSSERLDFVSPRVDMLERLQTRWMELKAESGVHGVGYWES